jgi:hypothetical protein
VVPVTLCPCSARFVAAERLEAAELVEIEDNPWTRPASAAACPKAPAGTAPSRKTSKEPNISLILSIDIPLQPLHLRVISTQVQALRLVGSVASKSTLERHSQPQNCGRKFLRTRPRLTNPD